MTRAERARLIFRAQQLRMEATAVALQVDEAVAKKNLPEVGSTLADSAVAAVTELADYLNILRAD